VTSPIWLAFLSVAGGFALLVWSADRLVYGASASARNLGVSDLGTIIVFALALLFFGDIGYLSWSERKKKQLNINEQASSASDNDPRSVEVKERKRLSR